jgi:hypothetical protein
VLPFRYTRPFKHRLDFLNGGLQLENRLIRPSKQFANRLKDGNLKKKIIHSGYQREAGMQGKVETGLYKREKYD